MKEVLNCGLLVVLKLANIKGMITCSAIRFEKVTYEVTYYDGSDQKIVWVNEFEFDINEPQTTKIGFIK